MLKYFGMNGLEHQIYLGKTTPLDYQVIQTNKKVSLGAICSPVILQSPATTLDD